ncbi:MAG: XapX domain-containing protein [Ancalomicrobiaceae bacterium]|nr:XapX domain-containing protein [Ancalomicrobiaceae bacterium]
MKIYVLSLGAGILVGVIYALLNVRSPAPPIVALVGLLGILVGEQLPPLIRNVWRNEPAASSWLHQVRPHVFGHMPGGKAPVEMPDRLATSVDRPEGKT